jgi:hypothetical protein
MEGRLARLRAVDVGDAARTIAIRNTPGFELGLPPIPSDAEQQREWIARQREAPNDYYFCVETRGTGAIEGLIGLTAVPTVSGPWSESGAWEWGRWASIASDPRLALEGAAMLVAFAMQCDVPGVWGRVIRANTRVEAFQARLGYNLSWIAGDERYFLAEKPYLEILHRRLGGTIPHAVGAADAPAGGVDGVRLERMGAIDDAGRPSM